MRAGSDPSVRRCPTPGFSRSRHGDSHQPRNSAAAGTGDPSSELPRCTPQGPSHNDPGRLCLCKGESISPFLTPPACAACVPTDLCSSAPFGTSACLSRSPRQGCLMSSAGCSTCIAGPGFRISIKSGVVWALHSVSRIVHRDRMINTRKMLPTWDENSTRRLPRCSAHSTLLYAVL